MIILLSLGNFPGKQGTWDARTVSLVRLLHLSHSGSYCLLTMTAPSSSTNAIWKRLEERADSMHKKG